METESKLRLADEFEAAFRRWVGALLPTLGADAVVAIDGKTSRRSGKVDATPLHLVSAFAAGAGLVLGHRARIGPWRTASIGVWMWPSPTTRCVSVQVMPLTISLS
jgi:hypothetical protein